MFVVIVEFEVAEGRMDAFLPLMLEQARNSLALEPDCHVFDVCRDCKRDNVVVLYEVYSDAAAFDAHLQSDHFHSFNEAVSPMTTGKAVKTANRLELETMA